MDPARTSSPYLLDPLTDLQHNTSLALRKYLLLREQHESLQQHLEQLRPLGGGLTAATSSTASTSTAGSPTRGSFSASPPHLTPLYASPTAPTSPVRTRNHHRRSSLPLTAASTSSPSGSCYLQGSALDPVPDEATLQEVADEEARLFGVNEGIKRTLTELLNCATVRNDRGFRTWVQCRLMDTEKELRVNRRRRSS